MRVTMLIFFVYLIFTIDGNITVHIIKKHSRLDFKWLLNKSQELEYNSNLIERNS
jgi:hypothetical protein